MDIHKILSILLLGATIIGCVPGDDPIPSKPSAAALENTKTVSAMPRSTKRGVSFSITNLTDAFLLSESISWYYNWGNTPNGDAQTIQFLEENNIDYCPMCWSGSYSADRIRNFVKAHPNTKYLLGFNEPNLTDQANMTPKRAGELWPAVVRLAKELNLQLGAPAMNYGTLSGYSDPIKWLDEFFAIDSVSIEDVDFIPIHCYMMNPSAVKGYVEKFAKYNKPIWMTEFCAWESISGVEQQKTYMSDVLNYFEKNPMVERYAWFMPRTNKGLNEKPYNQLLTKVNPIEWTALGEIFNGLSSQNKEVCLDASNRIPAWWYTDYNVSPTVTNSTDADTKLMLYNMSQDRWVEYQLDASQLYNGISIRYASAIDSEVAIYVDGEPIMMHALPKTGSMSTWQTAQIDEIPVEGKHYLRIHVISGTMNMNWFQLTR
jgi:hypothetical protein